MSPHSARLLVALENNSLKFSFTNDREGKHELFNKRIEYGEFHHLYMDLRRDENKFSECLRMKPGTFDYILESIRPFITRATTNFQKPISVEERLFVTLRFLSSGISYRQLAFSMRIGKSTIACRVEEVVSAIWNVLQPVHMPSPSEDMFRKISQEFYQRWNFPNCVGRIDGKHVRIQCPSNSGSAYYNYKQFYSIVLQAVVDAKLKFTTVDVGSYGRQSDGGVFRYSSLYTSLETKMLKLPQPSLLPNSHVKAPYVLVGDEAYPLTTYLLKPYSRKNLIKEKAIFNYRLSRARRVVECAFGICAAKWRILNKCVECKVETAVKIVKAVTVLHNVIIDLQPLQESSFSHESERESNHTVSPNVETSRANNAASEDAKKKQKYIL